MLVVLESYSNLLNCFSVRIYFVSTAFSSSKFTPPSDTTLIHLVLPRQISFKPPDSWSVNNYSLVTFSIESFVDHYHNPRLRWLSQVNQFLSQRSFYTLRKGIRIVHNIQNRCIIYVSVLLSLVSHWFLASYFQRAKDCVFAKCYCFETAVKIFINRFQEASVYSQF